MEATPENFDEANFSTSKHGSPYYDGVWGSGAIPCSIEKATYYTTSRGYVVSLLDDGYSYFRRNFDNLDQYTIYAVIKITYLEPTTDLAKMVLSVCPRGYYYRINKGTYYQDVTAPEPPAEGTTDLCWESFMNGDYAPRIIANEKNKKISNLPCNKSTRIEKTIDYNTPFICIIRKDEEDYASWFFSATNKSTKYIDKGRYATWGKELLINDPPHTLSSAYGARMYVYYCGIVNKAESDETIVTNYNNLMGITWR